MTQLSIHRRADCNPGGVGLDSAGPDAPSVTDDEVLRTADIPAATALVGCWDDADADEGRGAEPTSRPTELGTDSEIEMVRLLERTARFRVLRAVPGLPACVVDPTRRGQVGIGVLLDLETTGLSASTAEVIEVGMVKFAYDKVDGAVVGIVDRFSGLRQPWAPIPAEVTRITGIDDAMVAGHEIDGEKVAAFLTGVDLVVAHNARFDRPFAEARWPCLARLSWACSCTGVDWGVEGFDGARLGHLLMQAGYFHVAHRAVDDAEATLHLLALPLPTSGRPALAALLEGARVPTWRVWAEGSPFAAKDVLKERGYRWSAGRRGLPKSWYRDLPEDDVDAEVGFLERAILGDGASPRVVPISANDRFTDRAGAPRAKSA